VEIARSSLDSAVWYARCTSERCGEKLCCNRHSKKPTRHVLQENWIAFPDSGPSPIPTQLLWKPSEARTPAAFDDLVKRYGRRLLTVAMRITKNREDAEDVVQESFLKVFKKIDSFRGASKFSSWLNQIAINQALMLIRGNTQNFVSIDEGMEGWQ